MWKDEEKDGDQEHIKMEGQERGLEMEKIVRKKDEWHEEVRWGWKQQGAVVWENKREWRSGKARVDGESYVGWDVTSHSHVQLKSSLKLPKGYSHTSCARLYFGTAACQRQHANANV